MFDTITPGVTTDVQFGPINIIRYSAAASSDMRLSNKVDSQIFAVDPTYLGSKARCIGMGFEVHDVTAELNKQGTATVYMLPQTQIDIPNVGFIKPSAYAATGLTVLGTPIATTMVEKWPDSVAAAMFLEGTRQWEAQLGAYSVVNFMGGVNPASLPSYDLPLVDTSTVASNSLPATLNAGTSNIGQFAIPLIANDAVVACSNLWVPMHSKGVILSGLNALSVFTINANIYLETFPDINDPLVTLARPSCAYDPVSLQLISRAMKDLPIAVQVSENGVGDWIADVVSEVGPWIEAAASVLMPPLAPLAKGLTGLANKSIAARAPVRLEIAKASPPVKQRQTAPPNSWEQPKGTYSAQWTTADALKKRNQNKKKRITKLKTRA